jgi:hypothetical protein
MIHSVMVLLALQSGVVAQPPSETAAESPSLNTSGAARLEKMRNVVTESRGDGFDRSRAIGCRSIVVAVCRRAARQFGSIPFARRFNRLATLGTLRGRTRSDLAVLLLYAI